MDKSTRVEFDHVDRTTDPADFVRYLDETRATDFFQEIKQRSYALLDLQPGEAVCDVGCGTGDDIIALARMLGPGGRAVGVDASATLIAEARRRVAAAANPDELAPIELLQMDAQHLALADVLFDGVRAERLLQHVPDADVALTELVRIARPGARIVVWEADLDLFIIDAPDYAASRIVQRVICDGFRHGSIGHELFRRFKRLNLTDVYATPLARTLTDLPLVESAFDLRASALRAADAGLISRERATEWLTSLQVASAKGQFCCAVGGFLAFGRKPG